MDEEYKVKDLHSSAEQVDEAIDRMLSGEIEQSVAEAQQYAENAEAAVANATSAAEDAQEASQQIQNMTVEAETLPAGSQAAVEKTISDEGVVNLKLSIPAGETGPAGADGKDGKDGKDGAPGPAGSSAYQEAVEAGYTGTYEEFQALLAKMWNPGYFPLNGGTLTGDLDMEMVYNEDDDYSTSRIINLGGGQIFGSDESDGFMYLSTRDRRDGAMYLYAGNINLVSQYGTTFSNPDMTRQNLRVAGANVRGKLQQITSTTTTQGGIGSEVFNDFRTRKFTAGSDGTEYVSEGNAATGAYSHAEGIGATALGEADHAEGWSCTASGTRGSHAEGNSCRATGAACHAEGSGTKSSGAWGAHSEGNTTTASGASAHAEGSNTTATGRFSHSEGYNTNATVDASHAEGWGTTVGGMITHVEGYDSSALGSVSHAEGRKTKATNYASHAGGKYNKAMTAGGAENTQVGDVFVIGNGTSDTNLSNAFRVTYEGTVYGKGSFQTSGADYAEYFEWLDENPDGEDRVGYFVTMDGDKIKLAGPNDYILGIVSGNPCIIGNADEDWLGRWMQDDFGRFLREEVDSPVKEMQEVEVKVPILDEDGNETEETMIEMYEVETGEVIHGWRHKQNLNYNPDQPYIERKDRAEWAAVGMMGVLAVWDDGTCQVNGFCQVAEGGVATAADGEFMIVDGQIRKGYRVIERINDNVVKVVFR